MGFHGGTLLLFECVFRCPHVSTCFNPSYHPMIGVQGAVHFEAGQIAREPSWRRNTNSAHGAWHKKPLNNWGIGEVEPLANGKKCLDPGQSVNSTLFSTAERCFQTQMWQLFGTNVSPVSPNIFKLQTCLNIQVVSYPQTRKNLSEYQRSKPSQHSSVKRKRCCKVKRYKTFKAGVTHGVVWTTTIVQKDIYKCIMILNMYTYVYIYNYIYYV